MLAKIMKKHIPLCIAILLLLSTVAACSTPAEPSADTTGEVTQPVTEAATVDEAAEVLGSIGEIDWGGGEFVVVYADDTGWAYDEEVIGKANMAEAVGSGVINDAVFERNTLFEDMCHLTYVQLPRGYGQIQSLLTNEIAGGTHSFHYVNMGMGTAADCAMNGLLYNFLGFSGIEYEMPWWDRGTLGFNLAGNVFFMNGAHNLVDDDMTYVLAFNKAMMEEYRFESPYIAVKNGTWTLDHFRSLIQTVSADNGDGKWDLEDTYGFAASHIIGNTFFYGADLQYIVNDAATGEISLAMDSGKLERAVDVLDMALEMIYDTKAIYMGNSSEYDNAAQLFINEQAMFFSENAYYLRSIASTMENDFGIVPVPKYDESQSTYHTWTHSVGSTLSIPANIEKPEEFEKILEAYVVLSYQTVTPAYYETLLGTRNVRDPESAEILNIIFANRIYDMAQYYRDFGFADIFYNCVCNDQDSFVSGYEKVEKRFDRSLATLMKRLEARAS